MGNGLLMVEKSEASRFEEPRGEVKQGDLHFQRTSPIWVGGWWGEEKIYQCNKNTSLYIDFW